jgi:hypothetical protein
MRFGLAARGLIFTVRFTPIGKRTDTCAHLNGISLRDSPGPFREEIDSLLTN